MTTNAMSHTITLNPVATMLSGPTASSIGAALRRRWTLFRMDPRTRCLSQAADTIDLERRIAAWDEHADRAAAMFRNGCY